MSNIGYYRKRNFVIYTGHLVTVKSRRIFWAGHANRIGETRNTYKILVGKALGRCPIGRQ
jgi:hypothetical protein